MTNKDICTRATDCCGLKYWYGGKGQVATKELADVLKKTNPSVWTSSYYSKALKDCDGHTRVGDCSYLVCYAYNIPQIGSYQIATKYETWAGAPKDGMILWRKGHVGIYSNGKQIELRGIDADYQCTNYVPSQWTKILYDPYIDYDDDHQIGWHQEQGRWWYATGVNRGDYYKNCIAYINQAFYAFDKDGWMIEGEFQCTTDENGEIILVG